jgi:hypothetical protein
MKTVEIVEVAPRDGFQSVKPFIATENKIALIEELAACGFSRIEVGSFISPKAIPQMADTPEILQRVKLPQGLRVMALVPNAKGLQLARNAGIKEVAWVVSVTESHNRANVNRSTEESFANFKAAWSELGPDKPRLRFGLSTCFDCPWEGRVPEDKVIRAVERVIEMAPDVEIGICDTTGRAAPDHVAGSCRATRATASPSLITAMTRMVWASPTPLRPIARACAYSTARPVDLADVRLLPARRAIRPAKISRLPSSTWASRRGSILQDCWQLPIASPPLSHARPAASSAPCRASARYRASAISPTA